MLNILLFYKITESVERNEKLISLLVMASTIQFTQAKTSPQQNVANLLRMAESIIEL